MHDGGMHAIRLHEFGPAANLRYEEVDDVEPGPGQARIVVTAAGIHLIDTVLRRGQPLGPLPLPPLPTIPGREVAGLVDAIGADVDERWLGRAVVTHLGPASGGYAERAIRDVSALHELPAALDADAAVAMIGTGRTTMRILDLAAISAADTVLVTAAAGGVGSLLVQAARRAGAVVVGLAGGPAKVRRVEDLGADVVVDPRERGWARRIRERLDRPVSVVLDGVGGPTARAAIALLPRGGRVVTFGWASGAGTGITADGLRARGLSAISLVGPGASPPAAQELQALAQRALDAAALGVLRPTLQRYPLPDAARAHAALERRETMGKVVLLP
jgi:NADPH2:quinone reductase